MAYEADASTVSASPALTTAPPWTQAKGLDVSAVMSLSTSPGRSPGEPASAALPPLADARALRGSRAAEPPAPAEPPVLML